MPKIEDGDMATISQKIDWWGLNYYTPARITDAPDEPYPSHGSGAFVKPDKTDIGWEIDSSGFIGVVRTLYKTYDLPEFYITENGACYNMGVGENGEVDDQPRLDYYADHISVAADMIAEGYPLRGYFAWS